VILLGPHPILHISRIRVLRSAVCPVQWKGLMVICCGMTGKKMGKLGLIMREVKALTVKMETVTRMVKVDKIKLASYTKYIN
jgi:hypothetical protein